GTMFRAVALALAACGASSAPITRPPPAHRAGSILAPPPASLGSDVARYLRVATPRTILEHVELVDGTGAPPIADRNIYVTDGKITAIGPGKDEPGGDGVTVLDLHGKAVMPGIVGMHAHMVYLDRPITGSDGTREGPSLFVEMPFSAPRLYLANGVTTLR